MNPTKKPRPSDNIAVITARIFEMVLNLSLEERRDLLAYLESQKKSGRRKYPRTDYFMDVDFVIDEKAFRGFIRNISAEGMLIESNGPFFVGQKITLAFALPNSRDHARMTGQIVRLSQKGFGVKFNFEIEDFWKKYLRPPKWAAPPRSRGGKAVSPALQAGIPPSARSR